MKLQILSKQELILNPITDYDRVLLLNLGQELILVARDSRGIDGWGLPIEAQSEV